MIACQVAAQPLGWLVTFPLDSNAGLVFFSDSEKITFAKSCNIDLPSEDILYLDLDEIQQCPEHWYQQACEFQPPF
jgi:hypothetical protein